MYIAGCNMPGYLPDDEVAEFETFDEAKRYIIDEMLRHADSVDNEAIATDLSHGAEDVNLESGPFTTTCIDNYVYWVAEEE